MASAMASIANASSRGALKAAQLATRLATAASSSGASRLGSASAGSSSIPAGAAAAASGSGSLRYFSSSSGSSDDASNNKKLHPPKPLKDFVPKRGGGDVFNRPNKLSGDNVSGDTVTAKGSAKPHSGQAHRQPRPLVQLSDLL